MSVSALKEQHWNTSVVLKGRLQFKESFNAAINYPDEHCDGLSQRGGSKNLIESIMHKETGRDHH